MCGEVLATHSFRGRKSKLFIPCKSPFAMATPPSFATPSHTPVARRGCLKQDNKKINLRPARADGSCFAFSGLQPLLQSGTNPVTGTKVMLSPCLVPFYPWWHHSRVPKRDHPGDGVSCPPGEGGRATGTTWGIFISILCAKERVWGCQIPYSQAGSALFAAGPSTEAHQQPHPKSFWGPAQLPPVWVPPAILKHKSHIPQLMDAKSNPSWCCLWSF